jgi:hypothetical protein
MAGVTRQSSTQAEKRIMSLALNFVKITESFMSPDFGAQNGGVVSWRSLDGMVSEIATVARVRTIGEVVIGRVSVTGWEQLPLANGIIAILIGLLLPAARNTNAALTPGEHRALARLRPHLLPGARLSLVGLQPGRVNTVALGFTGGLRVYDAAPPRPSSTGNFHDILISS